MQLCGAQPQGRSAAAEAAAGTCAAHKFTPRREREEKAHAFAPRAENREPTTGAFSSLFASSLADTPE